MTKEETARLLDKAAEICVTAHAGQRDKVGTAYFQHPMRVAMRCKTDEEKIVAMLHDTIEDTDVTVEYLLEQGFPQAIVDGVLSVTKREGESYEDFVARAKQNPLGRVVKLHDLEDNLDVFRLEAIDERMAGRFTKYLAAHRFLLSDDVSDDSDQSCECDVETIDCDAKPIMTKKEYFRQRRAEINKSLRLQMSNKSGTAYNQETIMVRMADGKMISNAYAIDTFIAVLGYWGFDRIKATGLLHYDTYPLVARENIKGKYKEATYGWYVLSDCHNKLKAIYINELADRFEEPVYAEMIAK